ncbi:MAG: hypothetical protein NZ890_19495, partial [Myxococcota bacterium]|nr:hypothetical protein [Myxococcota bacterium]
MLALWHSGDGSQVQQAVALPVPHRPIDPLLGQKPHQGGRASKGRLLDGVVPIRPLRVEASSQVQQLLDGRGASAPGRWEVAPDRRAAGDNTQKRGAPLGVLYVHIELIFLNVVRKLLGIPLGYELKESFHRVAFGPGDLAMLAGGPLPGLVGFLAARAGRVRATTPNRTSR